MKYSEEVLKIVYDSQHERFQQSRNNLWKINSTFWTLLVLAIFYKEKLPLYSNFLTILICLTLFVLHYLFVLTVQKNLETDKKVWMSILKYWNGDWPKGNEFRIDTNGVKNKELSTRAWFWIVFQMTFSFLLIMIFYFIKAKQ